MKENLPSVISRLKPVFVGERFDLRILSRSLSRNTFSPLQLKDRTVSDVGALQDSYQSLGFKFHSYLQILVEAHPNAIGKLGLGPKFQLVWHNEMATPWVGNAREMIGIPNLFGIRSLFAGRADKMGFMDSPRFLVLPAATSTYHSLENKFMVAHELAHETENQKSHKDLIWREARADFLAFLVTGETDMIFPEGINLDLVRSDGTIYQRTVKKARSIRTPTVTSVAETMPHLAAFHHNSQIISSVLFELTQKLGKQKIIEYVQWMDINESSNAIPNLEPKPNDQEDLTESADVEYVDHDDLNAVKIAILNHLRQVGALLRKWSRKNTDEASQVIVESSLLRRGI